MFGELPLLMVPPTLYFVISYPMMGCSSVVTFVQLLLFLLLNSVVAEVSIEKAGFVAEVIGKLWFCSCRVKAASGWAYERSLKCFVVL